MRYWVTLDAEGREQRCISRGDDPAAEGIEGKRVAKLPREMEPWEWWDWDSSTIRSDGARRVHLAEAEIDFKAGMDTTKFADLHHRKAIEAHAYRANSDPALAPMLAAEAAATDIDLEDLVDQVIKNDVAAITAETNRRIAKLALRTQKDETK